MKRSFGQSRKIWKIGKLENLENQGVSNTDFTKLMKRGSKA